MRTLQPRQQHPPPSQLVLTPRPPRRCTAVVDLLGAGDVFGLVTFASAAREALPLTAMDAPGKRAAHAAIAACAAGGNTALEAGVTMAVGMFAGRVGRVGGAGSATQYVLLLTDGQANVGCTERSGIAASLRASLGALGGGGSGGAGPLTLSTFGFGTDADAALMQDLASAADGMYYFIADMGAIPIAFSEALGEAMSVALRNVVVEIRITPPGGGARLAEVYMEQGVTIDGGVARVSLGSMTAASRRDVLFAVTLPALPGPAPAPTPFVTVTVSYELPAAGAQPPGALLLLSTIALLRWLSPLIPLAAGPLPIPFFFGVLAGEEPIDHTQKNVLREGGEGRGVAMGDYDGDGTEDNYTNGNPALLNVDALGGLQTVGSSITVVWNFLLSDAEVMAVASAIPSVGGTITVRHNAL